MRNPEAPSLRDAVPKKERPSIVSKTKLLVSVPKTRLLVSISKTRLLEKLVIQAVTWTPMTDIAYRIPPSHFVL